GASECITGLLTAPLTSNRLRTLFQNTGTQRSHEYAARNELGPNAEPFGAGSLWPAVCGRRFPRPVGRPGKHGAEIQSRCELAQAAAQQVEDGRRDWPGSG